MITTEGRPLKYDDDYHPRDYIDQVKHGQTKWQIAARWGISVSTLYGWSAKFPRFAGAYKAVQAEKKAKRK